VLLKERLQASPKYGLDPMLRVESCGLPDQSRSRRCADVTTPARSGEPRQLIASGIRVGPYYHAKSTGPGITSEMPGGLIA
jgi:hypothetical protein